MNSLFILPLPLLIVSALFRIFPPKKINRFYGYRTKASIKNQDTWDEANRLAADLMLVGSVAYFFLMMLCVPFIQSRDMQILIPTGFLIVYLFGIIFVVERRLKKLFDESGKRIHPVQEAIIKFGSFSKLYKEEAVAAVVILAIILILFVFLTRHSFYEVVSGRIFIAYFDRYHVGYGVGAIKVRFFAFTLLAAVGLLYLTIVRWISNRTNKFTYWAFIVQTVFLCLYPLIFLTSALYRHLLYINACGLTPMRVCGLIYGLGGYILMLGFLCWAVRMPNKTKLFKKSDRREDVLCKV